MILAGGLGKVLFAIDANAMLITLFMAKFFDLWIVPARAIDFPF